MIDCSEKQGIMCTPSDFKYKLKLEVPTPDGSKVCMKVQLLKVDQTKICVEFVKTEGDCLQFYESFNTFKKYFGGASESETTTAAN